jgi:hypothetical protein
VSAYTDAMALEVRSRRLQYVTAAVLLVGAAALLGARLRSRPARWLPIAIAAALYAFAYLKEGFVRHDAHDLHFFCAFAVGLLAFTWHGRARWGAAALMVGAIGAIVLMPEYSLRSLYGPVTGARAATTQLLDLSDGGRRTRLIEAEKAAARDELAVPPEQLRLLRGHTVDVVPFQTAAIWAHDLDWKPEPLIQWHLAYDSNLDELNAAALADRGAERILRSWCCAVDGKVPAFEAPATYLALICNYRELTADAAWQVLARTKDRCGRPRSIATVEARSGDTVTIPAAPSPDELVYATIRFRKPLLERLESLLFKPIPLPRVTLDGTADHRFVPATADGPLVLRLPVTAGLSPFFDGGRSYGTLAVRGVASPFTVEFFAVPVEGTPWAPPSPPRPGRLEEAAVVVGGRRHPIREGAASGGVDSARHDGGTAVVTGWAARGSSLEPADLVAVFAGGRLVAQARPVQPRADVAAALGRSGSPLLGYALAFAAPEAGVPVRVFAVSGGRASELAYPAAYPWPR